MRCHRFVALLLLVLGAGVLSAQSQAPTVAPGLTVPSQSLPWALDEFQGKPQLVPIHHSTVGVNNHRGANFAGSLAGSFFYKPKMTTELAGLHARSVLHNARPAFYFHVDEDPDNAGDSAASTTSTWGLVRAGVIKDHRVVAMIQSNPLTLNSKRTDQIVETAMETLPGGWLKLTPKVALGPGEYALTPIFAKQGMFPSVVYDFTVDPTAPNGTDAVLPKSAL